MLEQREPQRTQNTVELLQHHPERHKPHDLRAVARLVRRTLSCALRRGA